MKTADGGDFRLRRIGPGSIIGEIALYLGVERTASVRADFDTEVRIYSEDALEEMRKDDPSVHGAFHEMMARLLAHRLADLSRMLDAYVN